MPAIEMSVRGARQLTSEQTRISEPDVTGPAIDPGELSAYAYPAIQRSHDAFRILLALDDDPVARAAVRVTAAVTRACDAVPTVVRVIELGMYWTPESLPELANAEELILAADTNHKYRDELLVRVAALAGYPVDWRAELDVGSDVRCIIRRAEAINAQLIVMGLEQHGSLRRALVGDTVRQVMSSGIAPVLAVTRSLETLPKHVVVGMDFTPSSIRAARWARRLLDQDGSLDLVYIGSRTVSADREDRDPVAEANRIFDARIEEDFAKLIRELAPVPTMRVAAARRNGRAADQLCTYAQEVGADLIALGSHRYNLLERIRLGSVSAAVAHDARCSVLVAPPEPM